MSLDIYAPVGISSYLADNIECAASYSFSRFVVAVLYELTLTYQVAKMRPWFEWYRSVVRCRRTLGGCILRNFKIHGEKIYCLMNPHFRFMAMKSGEMNGYLCISRLDRLILQSRLNFDMLSIVLYCKQSNLHLHTEHHTYTPNVCCHIAIMDLLYF
jgi:hypothetical protein